MKDLQLADARVWRNGHRVGEHVSSDGLVEALLDESSVVWADLLDPTPEHLHALVEHLGLSPTVVEDALAPRERPKVTRHDTHLFFTVYATSLGAGTLAEHEDGHGHLRLSRVSGIVLERGLVTIRVTHEGAQDAFDMGPVLRRWDEAGAQLGNGTRGPGTLVHGLLDDVVDGHFETIQSLDDALESLEDTLFAERRTGNDFVRTTYGLRKDLVALRRVVLPMREVVNALMRHRTRTTSEVDSWYEDLYDHVLRASEWTESLRDMVTTVFETNLSLQDARLNTIMKKLAGWAAVIAVPTAVTGWFGQNVPYPGFQTQTGLWLSVVSIVVLSLALYLVFKRRDWL